MAKNKQQNKRIRNKTIKIEQDRNIFNILLKPRIALIRNPMIDELVRESSFNRTIEPHLKQITILRQLLNPEKIRMLYTIKHEKPASVYFLAKLLNRDFKAVRQDLKVLEQNGFIKLEKIRVKNRLCSKPIIQVERINFSIEI